MQIVYRVVTGDDDQLSMSWIGVFLRRNQRDEPYQ